MPLPGMRWRFITINTKNSWLPADRRGFRNHDHHIHSSGDYRNPPPLTEHAELRKHIAERAGAKVILPRFVRQRIAAALCQSLSMFRLKAISVSSDHAHLLIELPDLPSAIRAEVGNAKREASRAIRDAMPGAIWSAGCGYQPVDDVKHFRACETYTLMKQGAGSWTWSYRDGGMWHEERVKL